MPSGHRPAVCAALLLLFAAALPASAQQWSRAFGPMGLNGPTGYDGEAHCLAEKDGILYVGGWFQQAGAEAAAYVAAWDGVDWRSLGATISREPRFILPQQTGLLVGGGFVNGVVFYDGAWHVQNEGLPRAPECAARYFDYTYIGNMFWIGDPIDPVAPILRWSTGAGWLPPPGGVGAFSMEDEVLTMIEHDGRLHLGGRFRDLSATTDTTWNHVSWSEAEGLVTYGRGLEPGVVYCMEPGGNGLWLGGGFLNADGHPSHGLAHFFGGAYTPVVDPEAYRVVEDMTTYQNTLYVLQNQATPYPEYVVRPYHFGVTSSWGDPLGGVIEGTPMCLDTGSLTELYLGGSIANGIVRWDGGEWVHLGGGIGRINHDRHWFEAMVEYEGDLVAVGRNIRLPSVLEGQNDCLNAVRWDGDAWHRMGDGLLDDANALAVYAGQLYAGLAWSVYGHRVYRWDGTTWVGAGDASGTIEALAVHDGELIAAGGFTTIGGVAANRVAAYDGATWRPLGTGMNSSVYALWSAGGALYAAGGFATVDGQPAARIARWTGGAWEPVGAGFDNGYVWALGSYRGELIAGGSFTASGGAAVTRIARWDGAAWQPLGAGIGGTPIYGVKALCGTTTDLFVGGDFTEAGGAPASAAAVWNGTSWSALAGGVGAGYNPTPSVECFLVRDGDLYLGGNFASAGGVPSCCIAQWRDAQLVPNRVAAFRATSGAGATPAVTLTWETPGPVAADAFRLSGRAGHATWDVAHTSADGRRFSAVDRAPALTRGGAIDYSLAFKEADGSWTTVEQTRVELAVPAALRLLGAVPNPFNPRTEVAFVLDREQRATLAAYDLAGRRVAVLADRVFAAGTHTVSWDGTDAAGRALGAGAYVVRLEAGAQARSVKVMLMK